MLLSHASVFRQVERLMKTIRGLSYEWEQILQMGKKLFKIKSNPLANIGSRSVGKWDPVPKCG